jgi:hypothetical protein
MKRFLLTLSLAIFAFTGNVMAQEGGTEVSQDPNGPVITLDKEVHDYGTINQGDDGGCVFTITNTGKKSVDHFYV